MSEINLDLSKEVKVRKITFLWSVLTSEIAFKLHVLLLYWHLSHSLIFQLWRTGLNRLSRTSVGRLFRKFWKGLGWSPFLVAAFFQFQLHINFDGIIFLMLSVSDIKLFCVVNVDTRCMLWSHTFNVVFDYPTHFV